MSVGWNLNDSIKFLLPNVFFVCDFFCFCFSQQNHCTPSKYGELSENVLRRKVTPNANDLNYKIMGMSAGDVSPLLNSRDVSPATRPQLLKHVDTRLLLNTKPQFQHLLNIRHTQKKKKKKKKPHTIDAAMQFLFFVLFLFFKALL